MDTPADTKRPELTPLVACLILAGAWLLVVLGVGLGGDFALNDDWAYAFSAKNFARTGEVRILDWAAPSLVSHIVWGGLLLRAFGDSYVVLRCGTLVFAFVGLFATFALGRRSGLKPSLALLAALGLGLSPWYINLAFTYMTDVPWMVMTLCAMAVFALSLREGRSPQRALVFVAGAITGIGFLTRQFSLLTVPAFLVALLVDARNRGKIAWPQVLVDGALFVLPVVGAFLPFQYWYTHVHGATIANTGTWERMLQTRLEPFDNGVGFLLYTGLWLAPLSLSLLWSRRLKEIVVNRRAMTVVGLVLVAFATFTGVYEYMKETCNCYRPGMRHIFMPYIGNIFYATGLGPPTVTDVYDGIMPTPHRSLVFGAFLTLVSIASGVVAASFFASEGRHLARELRVPGSEASLTTPQRATRVLIIGFAVSYMTFQILNSIVIFDRYFMPVIPVAWFLGLWGLQRLKAPSTGSEKVPQLRLAPAVAWLALVALLSVAGTREYLAWNGARSRAVNELVARGISLDDVDGGFEINGPHRFPDFVKRTHTVLPTSGWWADGSHYRIAFWPPSPVSGTGCREVGSYPYWTPPLTDARAMHMLFCPQPTDRGTDVISDVVIDPNHPGG